MLRCLIFASNKSILVWARKCRYKGNRSGYELMVVVGDRWIHRTLLNYFLYFFGCLKEEGERVRKREIDWTSLKSCD